MKIVNWLSDHNVVRSLIKLKKYKKERRKRITIKAPHVLTFHSLQDNTEKQFIYRHSRTVFDLMDEDGSNSISAHEFEMFGFMFNLQGLAVKKIFSEFDLSGDQLIHSVLNKWNEMKWLVF